ncbi:aspartate 1-decarboxylase [Mycolicibacterium parafortuitum]|uniref:Aspartate 1-decarboxylase n=1 Tax=Mycolicibacterium parafortuitum TaxID=39692 RepID=A0A7I7U7T6_MYCPF|nr:aspartate 1-decarboxylase [Mycolicibacterium parafortuitum]PQE02235.1 aspartate 1-decarboxylase [Mycobacterium sp. EPG1]BBY77452.1 aspartate 1-decarboxylase [Mycolicibacterium parafortuitum]
MQRTLLGGKIHRATVTQADLHYVGSITVDAELMISAGIIEGEQVHVVDVTTGARIITYVITGTPGSGVIGINGAAAHLISPGNLVIIMSFLQIEESQAHQHLPKVVHVDGANRIVALGSDPSEPVPGSANQMAGA